MHYDDEYPTCGETSACLRIFPDAIALEAVSAALGLSPTEKVEHDPRHWMQDRGAKAGKPRGWFLSSEGKVDSRDLRRHLDWLLSQLVPVEGALRALRQQGATVDIACYWLSSNGHGGPTISPTQSKLLAELQLQCWFDIYFQE